MPSSSVAVILITATSLAFARSAVADCPLDHYFLAQQDGKLFVDKRRIYLHGDPIERYYPLSWSAIYQRWSVGEPGFSDTSDPAYGFPPEILLAGTPNVDYQIWFEILDLSPDLIIKMGDVNGTELDSVGDRYNLSSLYEHHVHMKYYAYVAQNPPPEYPFYVTYRLLDELGPHEASEPFVVVFNVPAPAVEATEPEYCGILPSVAEAELTFTFHRAARVEGGPPVVITDAATHTQDYYDGYFDYEVSPDGMMLTLRQYAGSLPNETWLEVTFTEYLLDAENPDRPVIPFTQHMYTEELGPTVCPGDLNCDDWVDFGDINPFILALSNWDAWRQHYPDCPERNADINGDGQYGGQYGFGDINPMVSLLASGQGQPIPCP